MSRPILFDADGKAALAPEAAPRMVEICRSFSFKLNLGNYQSCDFFASEKSTCTEAEAEDLSAALYQFCRTEVMKSVQEVQRKAARGQGFGDKREVA